MGSVTPAKAGVHGAARQLHPAWIPAFAGVTAEYLSRMLNGAERRFGRSMRWSKREGIRTGSWMTVS